MNKQYKLRGINDDHNTCEVCGKTHLKKVMWLSEITEDGEILDPFAAGTTCGATLLGIRKSGKAATERAINEAAMKQVSDAVVKFFNENCIVRGNIYIPREMLAERYADGMTSGKFVTIRNEKYPLLNQRLSIQERIKFA